MYLVRCKTCLMPTTRPSTAFVDGECSACINFRKRATIDWDARKVEFLRIVDELKATGGGPNNGTQFHCIVPSSGGKDSTYQVLKLIELGLRPLVVTASTCHLTEIGRKNIDNLARYATTIEYTPNRTVRRKLNRLGLELVGDISLPEHMGIFSIPYRVACDLGISTIIYGESPLAEYGGPIGSDEARTMGRRYIMEHQGFLGMRPQDFIGMEGITRQDMADYMLPDDESLKNVTAYFLGQFFPWDGRHNATVAEEHGFISRLPCEGNWWEFENLDNAQTGAHDFFGFLKFGFGRLCAQISIDIRHGRVNRDEAYQIVAERDGEFPIEYMGVRLERILKDIGITLDEFRRISDAFTNKNLFGGTGYMGRPILKEFCDVHH